ncbi:MAG: hypothetical protein J6Q67_00695, partial [Clostridia bacterium]|nr:hypothetical protein [Clostridia bacterium]
TVKGYFCSLLISSIRLTSLSTECVAFLFVFFAPHFPFYNFNGDLKASIFEWENIFGNLYINKDLLTQ